MFLLVRFLRKFVRAGRLIIVTRRGKVFEFGSVGADGKAVTVLFKDPWLPLKLALNPDLYLGEAYMDGALDILDGSMWDLLELFGQNFALLGPPRSRAWAKPVFWLHHRITQWNSARRARRNVAHHYDLGQDLYESFLDRDLQYSCAYFPSPETTLDDAQAAKRTHLAGKLLLRRNLRVLDIGSGWGGLAIDLAQRAQVRVDGVTLSHEQLKVATERAEQANLASEVRFRLEDYRALTGCYDRIVSVGMFEHVGTPFYPAFFAKIFELLALDGVAVVHAIGSCDGPGAGNAWIRKYIFPGGYIPSLSEVLPAVEQSGLVVTDIEILRLHYAQTLRLWRERFLANWDTLKRHYDERFRRMWEFYLAAGEMSFRHMGLFVFQLQLAKDQEAVPLTRDYLYAFEHPAQSESESEHCAA
jgi:cyclopropane-fatty-acyl-phospholipid synthase